MPNDEGAACDFFSCTIVLPAPAHARQVPTIPIIDLTPKNIPIGIF
jgi:hypothetical protein